MTELAIRLGSDIINLLEGDDGYKLRLDGWVPQVARRDGDGYGLVDEVITLRADFASQAILAESVKDDIEAKIDRVRRRLASPVASSPPWLRWGLPGETLSRQALISDIGFSFAQSPFFPPTTRGTSGLGRINDLVIQVVRHPFWELLETSALDINSLVSGGCNVAATDSSVHTLGTVTGRIAQLRVSGTGALTEFWFGFRTDLHGGRSYFQPVWEFDNASVYNDAVNNGGTISWTSDDTDLLQRMKITMSSVTAIDQTRRDCQRGTHLVLLRARSTGTETFNVRLSDGFSGDSAMNTHSRVKVSSSASEWQFYPLGTVTVPPLSLRDQALARSVLANYALSIEAEVNTAGTGSLEMTRFVLIPQDEGFLHASGVITGSTTTVYITVTPDGGMAALTLYAAGTVATPDELDAVSYGLPPESANIVFAGHGSNQELTAAVDFDIDYRPCYLALSGTDGTGGPTPI